MLNAPLGIGHGLQDALERELNDPREESGNPQNDQLQKTLSKLPNMSNERLNQFSLTSGEYIAIYLILWIISTMKEKEVPTLHINIPKKAK